MWSVYYNLCSVLFALYFVLGTLCFILCALYSVLCAVCSVLCALCPVLCALCPVPCALWLVAVEQDQCVDDFLHSMLASTHQALQLFGFFGSEGDDVFFHPLIFAFPAQHHLHAISDPTTLGS